MKNIMKIAQILIFVVLHVRLMSVWADVPDGEPTAAPAKEIVIADAVGNEKIIRQAALKIGTAEPELKINIVQMKLEEAVMAMADKEADLLVFSGSLPNKIRRQLAASYVKYAADPVIFLVNKANPLTNLKSTELRDAFSGQITYWKLLNGLGYIIHLAGVAGELPGHQAFVEKIMRGQGMTEHVYRAASSREVMILAGGNPHLLGYCGAIKLEDNKVKALKVDGVVPTAENIILGKYRPVIFYTIAVPASASSPAKRFARFLTSDSCAEIIENAGLAPLRQPTAK